MGTFIVARWRFSELRKSNNAVAGLLEGVGKKEQRASAYHGWDDRAQGRERELTCNHRRPVAIGHGCCAGGWGCDDLAQNLLLQLVGMRAPSRALYLACARQDVRLRQCSRPPPPLPGLPATTSLFAVNPPAPRTCTVSCLVLSRLVSLASAAHAGTSTPPRPPIRNATHRPTSGSLGAAPACRQACAARGRARGSGRT